MKNNYLLDREKGILYNKTSSLKYNTPIIFKKKKNKSFIKTLQYKSNDTGLTRHYTPAAQEWFNSIYTYNKNYIKLLPTADKNLMYLLKSHFNFFVKSKLLGTKQIANRYRRLSAKRIFVGKGELKHSNNKVIITSYVYNTEKLYLKSHLSRYAKALYYPKSKLEINIIKNKKDKEVITYNRSLTLKEFLQLPDHYVRHGEIIFTLFWNNLIKFYGIKELNSNKKLSIAKANMNAQKLLNFKAKCYFIFVKILSNYALDIRLRRHHFNYVTDMRQQLSRFNYGVHKENYQRGSFNTGLDINEQRVLFNDVNNKLNLISEELIKLVRTNFKKWNYKKLKLFKENNFNLKVLYDDFDSYMLTIKEAYTKRYKRFRYLLLVNRSKFEKPFIWELMRLVKNMYNKKVEFNFVNLNKMHLNSDIFTQAVSLKLKNRNNKLFRVLRSSLTKINLPNVSRLSEKHSKTDRNEYLINKIRNIYINSMFDNDNTNIDSLNNLLLDFFPSNNLNIENKKRSSNIKGVISLESFILRSLKHKKLAGVRLEAKGRLTRRFTAARSVFKVKWKGGLKNVDSSFKKLSAIMLRGDVKSNVQYSLLNSKNRNGAYGVKGWVSSKE